MFDICPKLETIKTVNSPTNTVIVYHRKNSQMVFRPDESYSEEYKLSARWTPDDVGELRWCDVIVQGVPTGKISLDPIDLGPEDFKTKAQMLDKMRTLETYLYGNRQCTIYEQSLLDRNF
jgi:hypothetical protein